MQALPSQAQEPRPIGWFSIVGAPRCGTTSLARYLSSHPDICFSNPKEPHFFSRHDFELSDRSPESSLIQTQYLDRFFPSRDGKSILGEGSVSYLYAPEQMRSILDIWPDARFVIAVRNPLEMLSSLHQRHLFNGDESVHDFRKAWSLIETRRRGNKIPKRCVDPRLLDYKEIGMLGKHVRRFFEVVGRERCFVSVFDDLATNPEQQVTEVLEFLHLPIVLPPAYDVSRPSRQVKFYWLQRLLKRPPSSVREILLSDANMVRDGMATSSAGRMQGVGPWVMRSRKRLLEWNRKSKSRPAIDRDLRREMCRYFQDDVLELSALIGRDLRHWLDTSR